MGNAKVIGEGILLLQRHDEDCSVQAEHDEIFCSGPAPEYMHPIDVERLKEWGWRYDSETPAWRRFT